MKTWGNQLLVGLAAYAITAGCSDANLPIAPDAGDIEQADATFPDRPPREDATPPPDPALLDCPTFTPPTPCATKDGLDVYCVSKDQAIEVAGLVEYDPGLPLMAM